MVLASLQHRLRDMFGLILSGGHKTDMTAWGTDGKALVWNMVFYAAETRTLKNKQVRTQEIDILLLLLYILV